MIRVYSPRSRSGEWVIPAVEVEYRVRDVIDVFRDDTPSGRQEVMRFRAAETGKDAAFGMRTVRTSDIIGVR